METKNYQITLNKNKKNKHEITITLSGDISLRSINNLKEKIEKEIEDYKHVNFDIEKTENIDITFIQLIISIKNAGKTLSIKHNLSDNNIQLLDLAGIYSILSNKNNLN